ncbi:serine hydrolase domain-containing protein [Sphingosinicella soli]|uniref:CubicO group peptidase (Beta-lactamase class C family) n=1 Tax=Sphingosinicella soli TaxID=333708 RepID=A0A7W7B429_9SPHN|nr:serine hydrolase domain-containing protein [Sphingosinicella soli]MBB4633601.1 CubicO group peptidase (beta-lactamase class C family) [Sphingosinicella soli]
MIRSIRTVAAGAMLGALLCGTALAADKGALAAAIDKVAADAVAAGESPGLQVAVYKDGASVLVKSYGSADLELNVPVTNDSIFRIGSVTKQFTAVALLKLQEEGKLSLDDTLSKYYPDFPRAADVTLKQMLHHTSGIHSYTDDPSFLQEAGLKRTTDEWVAHFAKMPKLQDFEPGTGWHYSNTAYFLLGGVIEKAEAKPLATVFQDRFFGPLGMQKTALDDESVILPGRVSGYDATGPNQFKNAAFISMTVPGAAGAMRSSASDLVRWNAALFGGTLLKPASFKAMIAPGRLNSGKNSSTAVPKMEGFGPFEYGYALFVADVDGHQRIGHGGGIFGFSSSLNEFPKDRITVSVIANGIGKDVGAGKVADRIERIALGLPPKE